ncbi:MAG: arginine--tRNA ligase [Patescibacteria group bacterium]
MFGLEKLGYKIEIPPSEVDADLAIPAFKLDKEKAVQLIKALNNPLISEVKIFGNYVNIKLNTDNLAPLIIQDILKQKDKYGANKDNHGKTVIIEYSSPNIAKPMHIGHMRNTLLGNALKNIYKANGYKVVTANYIGDWGTHIGKVLLAHQKWPEIAKQDLFGLYVKISQEIEKNPDLENEAKELFKKLEEGDKKLRKIWEKFCDFSIKDFKKVYKILGVSFDLWNGESFYQPFIKDILKEVLSKGIAVQEKNGPVVVELKPLPSFLLQKSDGASLYSARDLALARWRLEKYKPEKIIYVAGHEQELYFKQIFETLRLLGYSKDKFLHVSYGIVTLGGEKMSTRKGHAVFLEDVLKSAIKKAKNDKVIGIGAVIYNTLAQSNERGISFNWDQILNLSGNSAPYIQYGYVRALGILNKTKLPDPSTLKKLVFVEEHEIKLIKMLAFFPEMIKQACHLNSPHIIANYLNSLVQEFNRFYNNNLVLEAPGNIRWSRLMLVETVAQVIKNGLCLLGIQTPKKM